jgi:RNA recognition motif-containing protein
MADVSNRPNSTIYVGGLHPTLVTAAVLSDAFIPFGEISDVSLPKPEAPSSTDLHRGFGYVEFEEASDAKEAVNNMDQSELYGRIIKVAMAKPERKADEPGEIGSKTAIWEQVGRLRSVRRLRRLLGLSANCGLCRKDIWRNMLSTRKIEQQHNDRNSMQTVVPRIRWRASRVWTLQDHNQTDRVDAMHGDWLGITLA